MPEGGTLRLESRQMEIGGSAAQGLSDLESGRYVELRVADSGLGMDRDTLDQVFEPFFTTKEEGRGVGLGLAMVHGTIRRTGGFVEASSTPGQGSTFRLLLPLSEDRSRSAGRLSASELHS